MAAQGWLLAVVLLLAAAHADVDISPHDISEVPVFVAAGPVTPSRSQADLGESQGLFQGKPELSKAARADFPPLKAVARSRRDPADSERGADAQQGGDAADSRADGEASYGLQER